MSFCVCVLLGVFAMSPKVPTKTGNIEDKGMDGTFCYAQTFGRFTAMCFFPWIFFGWKSIEL